MLRLGNFASQRFLVAGAVCHGQGKEEEGKEGRLHGIPFSVHECLFFFRKRS